MKFFKTAVPLFIIIGTAVFLLSTKMSQAQNKSCRYSLSQNPRVLIITGNQKNIETQLELLKPDIQAMSNRDIIVLKQNKDAQETKDSFTIIDNLSNANFVPEDLSIYYHYFHDLDKNIPFTLRLIGKDMSQKQQWDTPLTFDSIKTLIDKMPMRQREMQK